MLMQDVWITPSVEIPGWLGDVNVRNGIHALLKRE